MANISENLKSSIIMGGSAATAQLFVNVAGLAAETAVGGSAAVLAGGAAAVLTPVAVTAVAAALIVGGGYFIASTAADFAEEVKQSEIAKTRYTIDENANGVTKNADDSAVFTYMQGDIKRMFTPLSLFQTIAPDIYKSVTGIARNTPDEINATPPTDLATFLANFENWLNNYCKNDLAIADWADFKLTDSYNTFIKNFTTTKGAYYSICFTRAIAASTGGWIVYKYETTKTPTLYPKAGGYSSTNAWMGAHITYKSLPLPTYTYSDTYYTFSAGKRFNTSLSPAMNVIDSIYADDFIYSSAGAHVMQKRPYSLRKNENAQLDIMDYISEYGEMTNENLEALKTALEGLGANVDSLSDAVQNLEGEYENVEAIALSIATDIEGAREREQEDVLTGTMENVVISEAEGEGARTATAAAEATDPADPDNSGNTPAPIIPVDRGGLDMFTVYNPTDAQLKQFAQWLWAGILTDLFDALKKLYQNPFDAIIGLSEIYVSPKDVTTGVINVGKISSEVGAPVVNNKYVQLSWQPLAIPEIYYNIYDYDYTSISIFLPFIGITPLDTPDIMGKTVNLSGVVDVTTGALVYNMTITDGYSNVTQLQYIFNGNCSVQKPITGADYSSIVSGLLGVAAGVATGGISTVAGAATGAAGAVSRGISVKSSGSIGSNFGAMTVKKPYILVTHKIPYDPAVYNNYYGYPANKNVLLSDCTGFTRVKSIQLAGIEATTDELNEIETLLKSGVYI